MQRECRTNPAMASGSRWCSSPVPRGDPAVIDGPRSVHVHVLAPYISWIVLHLGIDLMTDEQLIIVEEFAKKYKLASHDRSFANEA